MLLVIGSHKKCQESYFNVISTVIQAWHMDDSDDDQRLTHHKELREFESLDQLAGKYPWRHMLAYFVITLRALHSSLGLYCVKLHYLLGFF